MHSRCSTTATVACMRAGRSAWSCRGAAMLWASSRPAYRHACPPRLPPPPACAAAPASPGLPLLLLLPLLAVWVPWQTRRYRALPGARGRGRQGLRQTNGTGSVRAETPQTVTCRRADVLDRHGANRQAPSPNRQRNPALLQPPGQCRATVGPCAFQALSSAGIAADCLRRDRVVDAYVHGTISEQPSLQAPSRHRTTGAAG